MNGQPLTEDAARQVVQLTVDQFRPSLGVVIAELAPLHADAGWVAFLQTEAYLRTRDPLEFLVTPALLVRPGPNVTPLPPAVAVEASLAALGLSWRDDAADPRGG